MAAYRKGGRSRKRRGFFGSIFSFLLICTAVFAAITIFFKVDEIIIEGDSRYSQEEIIAALGVEIGDHMMLIDQSSIVNNVRSELNYIGEVTVGRNFPDRLIIKVSDSVAAAYIEYAGDCWLIDENCRLLEKLDSGSVGTVAKVTGLSAEEPSEGEILIAKEDENNKVSYLSDILTYASSQGIMDGIVDIDMSNVTNAKLNYRDSYSVKLGVQSEVEYKLQMLTGVIEKLSGNERGVIDLSDPTKISFRPN